jgi:hypothetical protein
MTTYTIQELEDFRKSKGYQVLAFDQEGIIEELEQFFNKKKYYIVFNDFFYIDASMIPSNFDNIDTETLIKQLKETPLQFIDIKAEANPIERKRLNITKETKDFLEEYCNIERPRPDEVVYILNDLRFTIEEE